MSPFAVIMVIIGTAVSWLVSGYLVNTFTWHLMKERFKDCDSFEQFLFSMIWPIMGVAALIMAFKQEFLPWIGRQWKKFRAPKVAKKEEAKIEKIRMCPALKLKKYEQLLTRLATGHNQNYYGYQVTSIVEEFERIRDGKPKVKPAPEPGQIVRYDGGPLEFRVQNFAAQAAEAAQALNQMEHAADAVMYYAEDVAGPEQQMYRYR